MKVYSVNAYRWGSYENHSYPVGVYSTEELALEASEKEEIHRGGNKYFCEVLEWELNNGSEGKYEEQYRVVKEL